MGNAVLRITGVSPAWVTLYEVLFLVWIVSSVVGCVLKVRLNYWKKRLLKMRASARSREGD